MAKRVRTQNEIPRFGTEAEERRFWETHDSTNYVDWSAARRARFAELRPSTATISLRLPAGLLADLKGLANRAGCRQTMRQMVAKRSGRSGSQRSGAHGPARLGSRSSVVGHRWPATRGPADARRARLDRRSQRARRCPGHSGRRPTTASGLCWGPGASRRRGSSLSARESYARRRRRATIPASPVPSSNIDVGSGTEVRFNSSIV